MVAAEAPADARLVRLRFSGKGRICSASVVVEPISVMDGLRGNRHTMCQRSHDLKPRRYVSGAEGTAQSAARLAHEPTLFCELKSSRVTYNRSHLVLGQIDGSVMKATPLTRGKHGADIRGLWHAGPMPIFRHTSATGVPTFPWRRANAICSPINFGFFICKTLRSKQLRFLPDSSNLNRMHFTGQGQIGSATRSVGERRSLFRLF